MHLLAWVFLQRGAPTLVLFIWPGVGCYKHTKVGTKALRSVKSRLADSFMDVPAAESQKEKCGKKKVRGQKNVGQSDEVSG